MHTETVTDGRDAALAGDGDAWALAASVASDGLWYYAPASQTLRVSARAMELLGYAGRHEPPDVAKVKSHVHAADLPQLQRSMLELLKGKRLRAELELRLVRQGGQVRWTQVRARAQRDADGGVRLIAGSLADIDTRKRAELALREESRRDVLTGLPNRTALAQRLTARIARCAISPEPRFALFYLDLDRFKVINDSLGHAAGDALLVEAARRIGSVLGPDDLLARVGGDEFVVLLDECASDGDMLRLAAAMHAVMRPSVPIGEREVFTTLSVGVRASGQFSTKPADLLRDADLAMYQAKRHGGARTVVFDQRMYRETVERLRVQTELHHALHRDELRVAYQPVFDLFEKRLCGFEAFVRWQHPTRGRLSAADFVAEANETGLIIHIGRWMLNEVCAQLAEWREAYPGALHLSVALNLCDREIMDPEFATSVEHALATHGVPAKHLTLEMTEGAMTANGELAIPALRRLRDLGVQIQMDGFGRGSSSLTALRRLPISAIKIDRSFIAGIALDEESRAIVGMINAFARALGLEVIVEGIETREQAVALTEIGSFRYVQGRHFGAPAGESEAKAMLDEP